MRTLLFFTGHCMHCYYWARGQFKPAYSFDADADGFQAFEDFLRTSPPAAVRLMVDIVEEGFRLDTMPHVYGGDRRAMQQRLLNRHFRTTEFRRLDHQSRMPSGRRDDEVLVSGLTNPEMLRAWVAIINRCQVPLTGIYSLARLGEQLLPYLNAQRGACLLVSQQSAHLVRQSFYFNAQLKLSRLIPIRLENEESYGQFLLREINNTLRFLESQRLIKYSDSMNVHVLSPAGDVAIFQEQMSRDPLLSVSVHSYTDLAARLGVVGELPSDYADALYGQLLLSELWPKNNYATLIQRRHQLHQSLRLGMNVLATMIVLAACLFGGAQVIEGSLFHSHGLSAQVETRQHERLYSELMQEISGFPLKAAYVKETVDLIQRLDRRLLASPERMMVDVGAILDGHADIQIEQFEWLSTPIPTALPGQDSERRVNEAEFLATVNRYEVAVLQGQVVEHEHNYRRAFEGFQKFIADLKMSRRFVQVEVRRTPFDIDSSAMIAGRTGANSGSDLRARANFEVLLRLKTDEQHG